jgi:hypothetical protein
MDAVHAGLIKIRRSDINQGRRVLLAKMEQLQREIDNYRVAYALLTLEADRLEDAEARAPVSSQPGGG